MLSKTTVVLGAGGPWGTAWMTGPLLGLEDAGIDARHPQAIIGSSAGAILGAKLASGMTPLELFEDQTSIESQTRQLSVSQRLMPPRPEQAAPASSSSQTSMLSILSKEWDDEAQRIQAVCELAINAKTVSWDQFKSVMLATTPSNIPWPAIRFVATAIDVDARSLQAFDANSNVEMTVADEASLAARGTGMPNPASMKAAAEAGRVQGRQEAAVLQKALA